MIVTIAQKDSHKEGEINSEKNIKYVFFVFSTSIFLPLKKSRGECVAMTIGIYINIIHILINTVMKRKMACVVLEQKKNKSSNKTFLY